jgi:hypothetical protein
MFKRLLEDKKENRPTSLDMESAILLDRLVEAAGDLEISGLYGVAQLNSFRRPK